MEANLDAIVLRRRDAGENDRRVTMLTREWGKIDAIARGARKAGSRLAAATEPLAQCRIAVASKRNTYITQAKPRGGNPGLRRDFLRLSGALSLAELYATVLPYQLVDSDAFELLEASLTGIELHPNSLSAILYAQVRLLEHAGVHPAFGACVVSGAERTESEPFLSPTAGGYISLAEVGRFPDRYQTRFEVVVALDRLAALHTPPANIRFAELCLAVLLPFWHAIAEAALPATEALVQLVAAGSEPHPGANATGNDV